MSRVLSYTEIETMNACEARWSFRYGDQLAGSSLKEKAVSPLLSGGRAWGAAIAAWHANLDKLDAGTYAINALDESLEKDAERQREFGVHNEDAHMELRAELLGMLAHQMGLSEQVQMEALEEKLLVPIPSRSGKRASSRYKFLAYLDARSEDETGTWLEEFKLRQSLTDVRVIVNGRQFRMYAWAYWQKTGDKPRGMFINERLRAVPKQPRTLKARKKAEVEAGIRYLSHAKDQMCTVDAYLAACGEFGVEPQAETEESLRARRWHQRVPIMFRDNELEEVGRELVSAGIKIGELDSNRRYPLRHATRMNCGGCGFRDICPSPDSELIDALYERTPPKRDRGKVAQIHEDGGSGQEGAADAA